MSFIPYGRQNITDEDIAEVVSVLKSDFITQGPILKKFEESLSSYCQSSYCSVLNSATSALHIGCLALGVGPDDIVWTTPISFVATSNAALYCGAKIDFVDIDSKTYNISVVDLEKKLKKSKEDGLLPKLVIPVHLSGQSCEMAKIKELSNEYGFAIIEDASHAIGAKYNEKPVGNCEYSDLCVFSFHPVKIITTGEGGAITTNNKDLYQKIEKLKTHGITKDPSLLTKNDGPWYYEQHDLGFNYRMTDIQAALGLSQLKRLDQIIQKRHEIASYYNQKLASLPLELPLQHKDTYSSYHLYIIKLRQDKIQKSHEQIFNEIRSENIGINLHYIPIYLQPYYQKMGFEKGYCKNAEDYYSKAISIPMYPTIQTNELERVVEVLTKVCK